MNAVQRLSVLVLLTTVPLSALGQDAVQPYVEYMKRVETAQNVSPLDNGLFGEQVSLYNGSTAFSVTDIDIPGHHALPVQLTRTLAVELQPQTELGTYDSLLRGIGNWDVDVPYMAATYHTTAGNALRCNGGYVPPLVIGTGFMLGDVWQGISVNVPGRGKNTALGMQTGVPRPSGGATYKLATSERDAFDCIPMQSGFTGEGFRMTTSSGLRYYFDVATSRTAARLVRYVKAGGGPLPSPVYLDRNRLYLLASKIEDRFGNTVQFQYNANGHPTRMWANDGREINLTYTGGRLTTATSHGRTWQYQYTSPSSGLYARLSQVTQPDSSKWQYTYSDDLMPWPNSGLPPLAWCAGSPAMISATLTFTATHPSGAVGTFDFSNRRHYRSGVHATECMQSGNPADPDYDLLVPHFFDVMSINSKTLSGPGLSSMTWSYSYMTAPQFLWGTPTAPPSYPCTTCTADKTVTVTNPDNTKSRHTFGMRYYDNDGRQLKVETLRADDTVIRTETNIYMTEAQAATQPFHGVYGSILGNYISDPASIRVRPVTNRTIHQDGVNFVWQANAFDTRARPSNVTRSSTVSGSPARTEETIYWDNDVKWVLGQVKNVKCTVPTSPLPAGCGGSGVEMFDRTYDATYAMPLVTKRFGKPEQTLTWDTASPLAGGQRGTAKTVADGNGNVTTLSSWKRGTPQSINYPSTPEVPSGATHTAQVNDSGWIEWVNDENGFRTCYGYDTMGRISQVTYTSEAVAGVCNATAWAITTQVFQQIASAEYGIPAGHWRQTVSTGNGRKIVYFDAPWWIHAATRSGRTPRTACRLPSPPSTTPVAGHWSPTPTATTSGGCSPARA